VLKKCTRGRGSSPSASLPRVSWTIRHSGKTLFPECISSPSATLGEEFLPRVPDIWHSGKPEALGEFPFSRSVWTSPILSFTGFKYYLVLVDDYSHYMWTFPLRNKCDTTLTIKHFYAHVLNQFHLSIQCLQCDNGGEFVNHELWQFLLEHGIAYRLSCPYTSSQNGKAERAIHTTNDIMRTLLL
jgi:transposase InsO family protein